MSILIDFDTSFRPVLSPEECGVVIGADEVNKTYIVQRGAELEDHNNRVISAQRQAERSRDRVQPTVLHGCRGQMGLR